MSILTKFGTGALVAVLFAAPVFALAKSGGNEKSWFAPRSVGSTLEVAIGDNGKTVVRGAKVTDVSGSTITAQTIWDVSSITWTVRTDGDTDFIQKNGSDTSIADIDDGDYISFSGTLAQGSTFTVDADVVKNWSLGENRTAVIGAVTDIDGNDLTVSTVGRGTITVRTTSSTEFGGSIDALSDLAVDARIVAQGTYNADTKVLTATEVRVEGKAKGEGKGYAWGQLWKSFKFDFWNHKK